MKAGAKAGGSASGGGGVTSKKPYKPKAHGAKKPGSGSMKSEKSASGGGTPDGRNSPVSSPSTPPPLPVATPAKAVTGTSVRSLSRRLTMKNFDRAPKKEAISTVDPDDVEEDPTKGRCMLTPTAPIKMKWDIVMLFLILYNVIMVPVRICFEVEAPAGSIEFWLETFFDMLFIVDIVLNFNSAYVNDEGSLETNRSKIASTYLRGWFLIDGPSSLPTEPVMELIGLAIPDLGIGSTAPEPEGCVSEGGGDTAMMMPKLLRFLRMIRFMKLIRLLKAAKIFKVMEEELDVNMSVLKLFKLVFIVVFLGHLIACFVFLANKAAQDDNFFGMFRLPQFYGCQNTTTLEWVELLPDDWSPSIGNAYPEWPTKDDCSCEKQGIWRWKIVPGEQYVWVLYWTLTTMTTIGYGDVSPLTQGRMGHKTPPPPPPPPPPRPPVMAAAWAARAAPGTAPARLSGASRGALQPAACARTLLDTACTRTRVPAAAPHPHLSHACACASQVRRGDHHRHRGGGRCVHLRLHDRQHRLGHRRL